METKNKTNTITIELVLLSLLVSGCRNALPDSANAQKSTTESTVSVPMKQPIAMDAICDLSLFGENLGDDAHTTNTGDIDGDGYTDLIVGAQAHDSNRGRAYLYYGGLNGLSASPGLVFDGEPNATSRFGWLLGCGDVDNDGFDDIVIGAGSYNNKRGRAYLYYGGTRTIMDNQADLIFDGETEGSVFAGSAWDDIIVKDIDGDSYADLVIPAAAYNNAQGRSYLYWGSARRSMDSTCDLVFDPPDAGGDYSVGSACGDIDRDGYKDIVIGAKNYPGPGSNRYGRAYLYWGDSQEDMDTDCDLVFEAETESVGQFGANVGIGDIDDDGFEDVLIGANTFNDVQGRAYLYWGTSRAQMDADCDLKFTGEAGRGGFAELCICDGDVNADGYADVLISARQYDNGRGRAYLYLGDTKEKMDAQAELVLTGENERDWFGDPPGGSFGDFNNDGYDDLAIGARMWQSNSEQGRVYVYHGGPTILASEAVGEREKKPTKSLNRAASDGDIDLVKSLISKGTNVNSLDDVHRTPIHSAVMQGHLEVVEFLIASDADVNIKDKWGYTPIDAVGTRNRKEIVELLAKNGAIISTIHIAAFVGDLTKVKAFVQEGIDINLRRGHPAGDTPLHSAARAGHRDIVELFIANGADVNAKNNNGQTPIDLAVERNEKDIVELLLEKGAKLSIHVAAYLGDINKVKSFIETGVSVNVESGPRKRTPLYLAVKNKHKDVAKLLIDKGADVSSIHLLYYASWYGYRDFVELFIQKGADANSKNWSESPSHYAVWGGHADILEILLAKGADANAKDTDGWSLLHYTAGSGSMDMTKILLDKDADVNAKENEGGQTPLHRAVEKGHITVVELLIAKGADVNSKGGWDWTPLFYAVNEGHKEIAELLLNRGADVNSQDRSPYTPLSYAVWYDEDREGWDMTKLLASKGADVNFTGDDDWTYLHYIAEHDDWEAAEFLLAHGAKLNVEDNNNRTPLHIALSRGRRDMTEFLVSKGATGPELHLAACMGNLERVKSLVERGMDIDTTDEAGYTALYWATSVGREEVAEFLINEGAGIGVEINNNRPLLHQAAQWGSAKLVKLLISKGADANARVRGDLTSLHSAAGRGHKNIVELLIAAGADVKAKQAIGNTPLHNAAGAGQANVVEVLLAHGADVDERNNRGRTALIMAGDNGHTDIVELLKKHGAKE